MERCKSEKTNQPRGRAGRIGKKSGIKRDGKEAEKKGKKRFGEGHWTYGTWAARSTTKVGSHLQDGRGVRERDREALGQASPGYAWVRGLAGAHILRDLSSDTEAIIEGKVGFQSTQLRAAVWPSRWRRGSVLRRCQTVSRLSAIKSDIRKFKNTC